MGFELDTKRGVLNHYGVRKTNGKTGGRVDDDVVKYVEYIFTYDDLPAWGASNLQAVIPAYAKVLTTRFEVLTAFAGGTDYQVGFVKASDGTTVDADGLVTSANAPLANLNARGKLVIGSGALIGASVGADAVEVAVTATGTFTAGKARILVEYIPESV